MPLLYIPGVQGEGAWRLSTGCWASEWQDVLSGVPTSATEIFLPFKVTMRCKGILSHVAKKQQQKKWDSQLNCESLNRRHCKPAVLSMGGYRILTRGTAGELTAMQRHGIDWQSYPGLMWLTSLSVTISPGPMMQRLGHHLLTRQTE